MPKRWKSKPTVRWYRWVLTKMVMFETSITAGMEQNNDEYDFRITHMVGLVSSFSSLTKGGSKAELSLRRFPLKRSFSLR